MFRRILFSGGIVLGLLIVPALAQAQNATMQKRESGRTTVTSVTPVREGVIIRNGKPVQINGKSFTPLTQPMTFKNGAVLQPNGQLTVPGTPPQQLNEGDYLDLKGSLTRSVVVLEKSTTVSGDTTGIGQQLMQAFQQREREKLLQEKVRILEEKNQLLEKSLTTKPDAAALKKIDTDLTQVQQKLAAQPKQD